MESFGIIVNANGERVGERLHEDKNNGRCNDRSGLLLRRIVRYEVI